MLAHQVGKKYSTALFDIVRKKELIDVAYEQFQDLDILIKTDKSLLNFLLAPHILDQHKLALVRDVFGPRLEPLFLEFLVVLVNKHRIGFLHEIIEQFRALVADERGMVVARVTSAQPMSQAEKQNLIQRLKTKTGKMVELDTKVDSSIIGGLIVIVGNQIIDGSVKHNLSSLRDELMKLKVA